MKLKTTALIPLFLVVIFLLLFAANNFISITLQSTDNYISVLLIELAIYLLPCAIFIIYRKKGYIRSLSPVVFKPSHFQIILSSALFISLSGALYSVLIYEFGGNIPSVNDSFRANASGNVFLAIICLVAIPAFLEELLFRGIVLKEYSKYGKTVAVLFSSLCFAMFHFSFEGFIYFFISGMILSVAALATQSLITPFIIHLLHNLLSFFGHKYLNNLMSNFSQTGFLTVLLLILTLLMLFFFLSVLDSYYHNLAYTSKAVSEVTAPRRINFFSACADVFFSPYFLLLVIIFAAVGFDII